VGLIGTTPVRLAVSGVLLALLAGAGCSGGSDEPAQAVPPPASTAETDTGTGPAIVQPGAPGEESETLSEEELEDLESPPHTAVDVAFMQAMIHHHAQALRMTELVPDRAAGRSLPLFAERLELSQEAETEQMARWLEARDEDVFGVHDDSELMPGMLTAAELAALESATGQQFNRLFLKGMLKHHRGALQMVADLYDDGGGFESEIDAFARHVVGDQQIEIGRIEALLEGMGGR
jgi:uncharacterized protein (DUF305 family)